MKSLFLGFIATLLIALTMTATQSKAQAGLLSVTKITSATTAGGSVLLETSGTGSNAVAVALQKGKFYVRTQGYTGGIVSLIEHGSAKLIFRGPVSAITIPGYATDSLKVLFCRQYLTN